MSHVVRITSASRCLLSFLICALMCLGLIVRAQEPDDTSAGAPPATAPGDQSGDNGDPGAPQAEAGQDNAGPVRLARFSSVQGNVTWRPDPSLDWSPAGINLPLRQGADVWVSEGGRAELQFDDGSRLRLASGTVLTLVTLYSDSEGEFTEIKVTGGLATLRLLHDHSLYQVDTPLGSVKAVGPARVRIGVDEGAEIAVQDGKATIEGEQGKADLQAGDYLDLPDANASYDPRRLPNEDGWDQWNDDRDRALEDAADRPSSHYLPANIDLVADDLDSYGTWREDSHYGEVWCPRVNGADWRPYEYGHWTWVHPFGWTWVADEPWGWAPYHYGTWCHQPYGWAWVPGPVNQYWCPAVVHFSECDGRVAWCPLAPGEVRYPAALAIGFHSGNWSLFFSIGQAGCYYPSDENVCVGRGWRTPYVNRAAFAVNVGVFGGAGGFDRGHEGGAHFVPRNARFAAGATYATLEAFGGRGGYQPLARGETDAFVRGQSVGLPSAGHMPLAGPLGVKPTSGAFTPSHIFTPNVRPPQDFMNRPVFRAPLPAGIARTGAPATRPSFGNTRPGGGHGVSPFGNNQPAGGQGGSAFGDRRAPGGIRPPASSNADSGTPFGGRAGSTQSSGIGRFGQGQGTSVPRQGQTPSGLSPEERAARARASLGLTPGHLGSSRSGDTGDRPFGTRSDARTPLGDTGGRDTQRFTPGGSGEPRYGRPSGDGSYHGSSPYNRSTDSNSARPRSDPSYSPRSRSDSSYSSRSHPDSNTYSHSRSDSSSGSRSDSHSGASDKSGGKSSDSGPGHNDSGHSGH